MILQWQPGQFFRLRYTNGGKQEEEREKYVFFGSLPAMKKNVKAADADTKKKTRPKNEIKREEKERRRSKVF